MFRRSWVAMLMAEISKQQLVNLVAAKKDGKQDNTLLVDVRSPAECEATGMLPGAINIPVAELDKVLSLGEDRYFKKVFNIRRPDPERTGLVFYCASGARSQFASSIATGHGFSSILHFSPGMDGWDGEVIKAGGNSKKEGNQEEKK